MAEIWSQNLRLGLGWNGWALCWGNLDLGNLWTPGLSSFLGNAEGAHFWLARTQKPRFWAQSYRLPATLGTVLSIQEVILPTSVCKLPLSVGSKPGPVPAVQSIPFTGPRRQMLR